MAGVGSLMTGEHVSVGDNIQTAFELELEQAKLQRTPSLPLAFTVILLGFTTFQFWVLVRV